VNVPLEISLETRKFSNIHTYVGDLISSRPTKEKTKILEKL
jgi:hypothetical protein